MIAGLGDGSGWAERRRALRLAWWRHRRLGITLAIGLALVVGLRIAQPGGPPLRTVPVLDRNLGAGAVVGTGDVRRVAWPVSAVPAGLLADPVGHTLAGPARRGEALTDARVVGASLLSGQAEGLVAVSIQPAGSSAALVQAGDRVDVFAAGPAGDGATSGAAYGAERVADGVLVLAVDGGGAGPDGTASADGSSDGSSDESTGGSALGLFAGGEDGASSGSRALILAVDRPTAADLAAASGGRVLSVALLPQHPAR